MRWLASRLSRKFAVGTAAGLLVSSLVFLLLFLALYRAELASERAGTAGQVNQLLQTSLENAMLKRDLEGLQQIVNHLGRQPAIAAVFITNPQGEVRFASDPALLGSVQPPPRGKYEPYTEFIGGETTEDRLRSVNPVANRPACRECHGPMQEHPINGVLYVDYDAAPIRRKAQLTTLLLMGSGAVIVMINLAGGWWFMRRYVLAPVGELTSASRTLAEGDLGQRAVVRGNDELSDLGQAFNRMADQLQERIDESERQRSFLQALIDAIPDGLRVIRSDYTVVLTNKAYRRQMALGEADGVNDTCHRISHQSDEPCPGTLITCPVREIAKHNRPVKALHRHYDSASRVSDVEIYAAPLELDIGGETQTLVVESIRDLSKQVKYSHEQKLSELGKLATGVAHEIHNPLASVRLALDSLRHGTREIDPEFTHYLELVDDELDKCLAFTERLLRLGMQPSEELELVEIARVIEDTLDLLRWETEQLGVKLSTGLAPGLRVLASDSELRMVVLNLAQNALHAMPQGGELHVSSRRSGSSIAIAVQDSGVGIDPENSRYIFDPFFSRRADGAKGTGLGLSIVRTIVENYGGSIGVESEAGNGSTFTVLLPDADHGEGDRK